MSEADKFFFQAWEENNSIVVCVYFIATVVHNVYRNRACYDFWRAPVRMLVRISCHKKNFVVYFSLPREFQDMLLKRPSLFYFIIILI
jgi:hypothetical protein